MLMVSTSLTPISQLLVRKTMVSLHSLSALAYKIRVFPRLTTTTYRFSSAPKTAYPLQYELIRYRPVSSKLPATPRGLRSRKEGDENIIESTDTQEKCESESESISSSASETLDKSKRKYYRKRRKRMYGSETDDERPEQDKYIELKPEIVDFPTVQSREEELYFYDAFAYPWEKDKHYRMVYQLEKKYFPDQCLDKAFLDPGQSPVKGKDDTKKGKKEQEHEPSDKGNDNGLIFFEEEKNVAGKADSVKNGEITEKKVEDFFKSLKKAPKANEVTIEEPFLISRRTQLPHRWDGPNGTVVLINKPKGWTSFTVCGKLRRLVKVQKVGHAGTLDPMATGLLIVCVGKATKLADRYQGMIKGYSGVFRLGEATSTWDADSPVIQREPWEHIKDADIKKAAASFCGEIWQVPPMFSAIKVDGEKMYEKARRGEMVELSPRRVSIFQFDIERSLSDRQNLIFRVVCSKGTYIRSLCADFGKTLKSCAHLTALRRDSIGEYSADDAWEFEELQELILKNYL